MKAAARGFGLHGTAAVMVCRGRRHRALFPQGARLAVHGGDWRRGAGVEVRRWPGWVPRAMFTAVLCVTGGPKRVRNGLWVWTGL